VWRGAKMPEEYAEFLRYTKIREDYVDVIPVLLERVPPVTDLIRFVVRECFPLHALDPSPDEFVSYMAYYGFDELWCRGYWEAHWVLPALGVLYEAFWRGVLTENEVRKFIVWHDYKPAPRPGIKLSDVDIVLELAYKLPGRILARWGLEWGIWDEDAFKIFLAATGLHPDYVDDVFEIEKANVFREHISRVRSAAIALFVKGYWSWEDVDKTLMELLYPEPARELMRKEAELKREEEHRDEMVRVLREAYRRGLITRDDFVTRLAEHVVDDVTLNLIVAREDVRLKLGLMI